MPTFLRLRKYLFQLLSGSQVAYDWTKYNAKHCNTYIWN